MVNPCLYAFTNDNFRESFISAFRCAPDPILGGTRSGSEYAPSTGGNNNSFGNTIKIRKLKAIGHTEYTFTTVNTESGTENNVEDNPDEFN